jgi:hypothetical protein
LNNKLASTTDSFCNVRVIMCWLGMSGNKDVNTLVLLPKLQDKEP